MKTIMVLVLTIFLLLTGCSPVETDQPEDFHSDTFAPQVLSGADVAFDKAVGSYLLVGNWVHVHLDLEFRNMVQDQAATGVEILPPFEPLDDTTVYTGTVSGMYSEFAGANFDTAELSLSAAPDAAIQVIGHTSSATLPGGIPLVLGINQTRKVVGTISYRTSGRILY